MTKEKPKQKKDRGEIKNPLKVSSVNNCIKSNEGIKKETENILNDFEDILSKFSLLQYQQQVIKLLTFATILVAIIIIFSLTVVTKRVAAWSPLYLFHNNYYINRY